MQNEHRVFKLDLATMARMKLHDVYRHMQNLHRLYTVLVAPAVMSSSWLHNSFLPF